MARTRLNVVMYRPRHGNYEHWALYLDNGGEHTIYEVIDEHPRFKKNIVKGRPQNSNRYLRSYQVGTIGADDISAFRSEVQKAKVDNATVHWNCQDYVVELVEALVNECIIDEEDYEKVKSKIHGHFGPC